MSPLMAIPQNLQRRLCWAQVYTNYLENREYSTVSYLGGAYYLIPGPKDTHLLPVD
jgi:hypothetical protein